MPFLDSYGKRSRKKEVAQGIALHPENGATHSKSISPNYALVDVSWMHNDFADKEIDIPGEHGERYI